MTAPLYVRMSAAPGVFAMSRATLYRAASRGDLTEISATQHWETDQ
jgi:hypothetical protein